MQSDRSIIRGAQKKKKKRKTKNPATMEDPKAPDISLKTLSFFLFSFGFSFLSA